MILLLLFLIGCVTPSTPTGPSKPAVSAACARLREMACAVDVPEDDQRCEHVRLEHGCFAPGQRGCIDMGCETAAATCEAADRCGR